MLWEKGILIYNGNAGQKGIEDTLGICVPILSPYIKELALMPTTEPREAENICRRHGEETDIVIILGGDGTVHECVNGLAPLENRPAVAILPGGTCNDFSRMLKMPQDIRAAAETIIQGETSTKDIGQAGDRYFSNFWGIGLIAETSANIDESQKSLLGKVSYFISAVRTVKEAESFSYKLTYDGQVIEDEAILILVCNGGYIGTAQLPFEGIESNDGKLDVIIVKNSSLGAFREILFNKESSTKHGEGEVLYLQAKSVSLETERHRDVDTDGEIYMKTPADIKILGRHMQFICGNERP